MRGLACLFTLLGVLAAGAARADESTVVLKDAPGRDAVQANCLACHSADYIVMNSPFLDEKGWRASVTKMINVMGAPITPEDAEEIVRYLSANYGR
jgi:sulfite dehydrogenase (cytochrome) subunit B